MFPQEEEEEEEAPKPPRRSLDKIESAVDITEKFVFEQIRDPRLEPK